MNPFQQFWTTLSTQYADFSGRSRRAQYWPYILVSQLISGLISLLSSFWGNEDSAAPGLIGTLALVVMVIIAFGLIVPNIAAAVRRLHDTGRSGWYYLIGFIPFIGWLVLFVFLLQDSQNGENQWGLDPKAGEAGTSGWPAEAQMQRGEQALKKPSLEKHQP